MARDRHTTKAAGGWSEDEVRAAVTAYFSLLKAEQAGESVNKAQLYRDLSARFPNRPPKAFELKFQNISAILYEQHLPYCSGLKPRGNYQRLLRLLVLDHLDRTPLPSMQPHEILASKLRELRNRGLIPVRKTGSGRFGLAIEEALGIPQNSAKTADFMGIELKTKADASLQTLFSRTPSRYVEDSDKQSMFRRHCYFDGTKSRNALYTSFSKKPDSLGFHLLADERTIRVQRGKVTVLEYDAEAIEQALLSKHSQTVFLAVAPGTHNGAAACSLESALYCKWPSVIRFLRLIEAGDVYLDFTMSESPLGAIKDHGFLWRIRGIALQHLYLHSAAIDL
jgi:hypothetical protein